MFSSWRSGVLVMLNMVKGLSAKGCYEDPKHSKNRTKNDKFSKQLIVSDDWIEQCTYRARNQESREQVPKPVEGRRDDCCELGVGRDGNGDHTPVCEIEERQVHEEDEVNELWCGPLKLNHGIHNASINQGLCEHIRPFNRHLAIGSSHHNMVVSAHSLNVDQMLTSQNQLSDESMNQCLCWRMNKVNSSIPGQMNMGMWSTFQQHAPCRKPCVLLQLPVELRSSCWCPRTAQMRTWLPLDWKGPAALSCGAQKSNPGFSKRQKGKCYEHTISVTVYIGTIIQIN